MEGFMTDYKYTYQIDQFPNGKYDTSKLDREIRESSIVVALSYLAGSVDRMDIFFKNELEAKDWTTLSGVVADHDGIDDYVDYNPVKIEHEFRDKSGKLRVHQTSRQIGMRTIWTGRGDDPSDVTDIGNGEHLTFTHKVGDGNTSITKYFDFNIIENETWIHEGYITWKTDEMIYVSFSMVPRVVTVSGVTGGDKAIYGGYLVVPTAPGNGNIEVVNDITDPNGGFVCIPVTDFDVPATAFWDADYNSSAQTVENIRPNYDGKGKLNLFSYEVGFARFVTRIPLIGTGNMRLQSSDADQIGHGMRLKMTVESSDQVEDYDWSLGGILCLHRKKSVWR
jgi:hypothetical protein